MERLSDEGLVTQNEQIELARAFVRLGEYLNVDHAEFAAKLDYFLSGFNFVVRNLDSRMALARVYYNYL